MTMAAAIENRTAEAPSRSRSGRIASVDILGDLGAAEAVWRAPRSYARSFPPPISASTLLSAWQRHVGAREGLRPFIVIAHDGERRPLLLLPLALGHAHGVAHRRLHGRQAHHLQHGVVGPRFRRERHAGRSRGAGRGDRREVGGRRAGAGPAAAALATACPIRWRCCRTRHRPTIVRC